MSHPVDNAVSAVRTYIEQHGAAFLDDLVEWLRIPSVSAQPDHATDVRRSADWLAAKLKETGFPTAEVWPTRGAPAVFAEWPSGDPQAPTVLVYGHHDVQPAAREDGWNSEPFDPVVRENRLYARGAADDKGQVFFHTLGVRAHLAATGRTAPAVNLKLLIEGEEESGSPHFRALVEERAERLTADAVVVSDTGMWSEDTPTVCTGMRGLAECEIRLHGPDQDIHSGSFGGAVPNPATAVARLVAALHDEHARVAIPGFYDGVADLTDRERELFAELPFDERQWLRTAKSYAAHGEAGHTTLERIWARPTAEVNGIGGGYQGPGSKTIIPSSAMVKLSFRLVAGQDPDQVEKAVRAWAGEQVPAGIRCEVVFGSATRPCLTPLDHPALQSVVRAMGRAFGKPVRFTREGGSGPAADLQEVLGAPVLFLGISVPSDGWHAPTRRWNWTCSSRVSKPPPTSGATWGALASRALSDVHGPGARPASRAAHWKRRHVPPSPPGPGHHPPYEPPKPPAEPNRSPGELEAPVTTWTDRTADRPISLTAPSGIDRAAHHRLDEAWLAAAWSHPSTRCFVVSGGQVLIDETPDGATELVMTPSFEAPLTEAHRYFLGTDEDGTSYFALQKDSLPGRMDQSARPAGLREAGLLLSARDAGLMAHAVALENWQRLHRFCSRCGERTVIAAAGHIRRCPPAAPSTTRAPTPR